MAVLVTDGNQRSTLAVVRALGRAGIPVAVGESQASSLAGSSKHCKSRICYPAPEADGERFLAFLRDELRQGPYQVLIPTTDITMQLIASARASFEPIVRLPFPGPEQMRLVQDKRCTIQLAQKVGIPCPETFLLEENESVGSAAARVHYPAIIKPRYSRFWRGDGWVSGSVRYARDASSLVAEYGRVHKSIPQPLVQERIEGEGRGVFLLIWKGELKAAFCHRRLREKPPWGGVSVLSESLPLDSALVEKSLALLKAMDWQGVAMVEYKVDRRDGQAKLMEVNGRFWGSLQLAVDAGVNFPLLLYRLALGEDVSFQPAYAAGIKNRWLLGDLDHLWMRFKYPRPPNGSPAYATSRLGAFVEFMKFYQPGLHNEIQRRDDPGPGWFEIKQYMGEVLHRPRRREEQLAR